MTDINVDELIAEGRRAVEALGVRQSTMLVNRLADALEAVKRERDEALAVIEKIRDYVSKPDIRTILDESPTERETPADEHVHDWKRRQNITTRGYAMSPYWACECGAAREEDR